VAVLAQKESDTMTLQSEIGRLKEVLQSSASSESSGSLISSDDKKKKVKRKKKNVFKKLGLEKSTDKIEEDEEEVFMTQEECDTNKLLRKQLAKIKQDRDSFVERNAELEAEVASLLWIKHVLAITGINVNELY